MNPVRFGAITYIPKASEMPLDGLDDDQLRQLTGADVALTLGGLFREEDTYAVLSAKDAAKFLETQHGIHIPPKYLSMTRQQFDNSNEKSQHLRFLLMPFNLLSKAQQFASIKHYIERRMTNAFGRDASGKPIIVRPQMVLEA